MSRVAIAEISRALARGDFENAYALLTSTPRFKTEPPLTRLAGVAFLLESGVPLEQLPARALSAIALRPIEVHLLPLEGPAVRMQTRIAETEG